MGDAGLNLENTRDCPPEAATDWNWYAVFCRPGQEGRAVWHLRNQGFAVLYPRIRARVRRAGKWQDRVESMFPRYVFVQLRDQSDLAVIRSTRGAIGLVRFGGYVPPVPEGVIEAIAGQLDSAQCLRPAHADDFAPGEAVCVVDGPFTGALAWFAGKAGEGRVAVLLEIMQRERRVELYPGTIRRA